MPCLLPSRAFLLLYAIFALLISTAGAQPVIQADPLIVEESRLASSAAGTTRLVLAQHDPVASRTFARFADLVANLHISSSGAGAFGAPVSLRGLSNTPYFGAPSVAVSFDDIPLGNAFTFPTELFGFSTVSVQRGPQPTSLSRGAYAGSIIFTSPEPATKPTAELRAGIGNHDARNLSFEARTDSSGRADATVSAAYLERDGFVANTQLGTRVDHRQSSSHAARLRIRLSDSTEIAFQVLGIRRGDGAQPLVPLGGPLFSVARGRDGSTESVFGGGALKFSFDAAPGRLSSTTSYTSWTLDPYESRLVLPPPLDSRLKQSQRAWNQELRLISAPKTSTPWLLGIWLSDTQTEGAVARAIPNLFPIEESEYDLESQAAAVFGEVAFDAPGAWRLTAALRAERTGKDFDRRQRVPAPGRFTARRRFDSLLPKLSASRAINGATTTTVSIGYGSKPGGWSAYTDNPALAGFAAERALAFEAGIDTQLMARTLTLAARVFDYEIRNYQIERSFTATDYLVVNAPRARSIGAEVETGWRPGAGWTILAMVGVADVTLREFTDPFTGQRLSGHTAPYAPRYDASMLITYRHGPWFAAVGGTAIGKTHFDESEQRLYLSRSHATAEVRLGYETPRWRVTLHTENAADARYTTLIVPGVDHVVPGDPRTFGIELALRW